MRGPASTRPADAAYLAVTFRDSGFRVSDSVFGVERLAEFKM